MKNLVFPLFFSLMISACGNDEHSSATATDTLSAKDSLKKAITENLPPSTNIKQFEWIYSSFAAAATTAPKNFDVFINKETGLWIIHSLGAMPEMYNVKTIAGVTINGSKDSLVPFDREKMICSLQSDELPEMDCDNSSLWSKSGCFTSETNTFKASRIWDYAGLNENDTKKVEELAGKITRVVINTELHMRFYFAEVNGTWYLVFLDMRVPCSA